VVRGRPDFYTIIREKGVETRVYYRIGSINPGKTETLVDLKGQDAELLHLEFSTNYEANTLMVYAYRADGTLEKGLQVLHKDGSTRYDPSPSIINTHQSIVWFELVYDTTNNWFKFGLGYPMRFANGLKITVTNAHPTLAKNIACEAIVAIRG